MEIYIVPMFLLGIFMAFVIISFKSHFGFQFGTSRCHVFFLRWQTLGTFPIISALISRCFKWFCAHGVYLQGIRCVHWCKVHIMIVHIDSLCVFFSTTTALRGAATNILVNRGNDQAQIRSDLDNVAEFSFNKMLTFVYESVNRD